MDLNYLLKPVYRLFLEVFKTALKADTPNNQKFLALIQKTYEANQIKEFIQCLNHGMKSIAKKKSDFERLELT